MLLNWSNMNFQFKKTDRLLHGARCKPENNYVFLQILVAYEFYTNTNLTFLLISNIVSL